MVHTQLVFTGYLRGYLGDVNTPWLLVSWWSHDPGENNRDIHYFIGKKCR